MVRGLRLISRAALVALMLLASVAGCCPGDYSAYHSAVPTDPARLTTQAVFYTPRDADAVEPAGTWMGSLLVSVDHPEWCRYNRIEAGWPVEPLHARAAEVAAAHGGTHLRLIDEDRSFCTSGYARQCAPRRPIALYDVLRVERSRWEALPRYLQPGR